MQTFFAQPRSSYEPIIRSIKEGVTASKKWIEDKTSPITNLVAPPFNQLRSLVPISDRTLLLSCISLISYYLYTKRPSVLDQTLAIVPGGQHVSEAFSSVVSSTWDTLLNICWQIGKWTATGLNTFHKQLGNEIRDNQALYGPILAAIAPIPFHIGIDLIRSSLQLGTQHSQQRSHLQLRQIETDVNALIQRADKNRKTEAPRYFEAARTFREARRLIEKLPTAELSLSLTNTLLEIYYFEALVLYRMGNLSSKLRTEALELLNDLLYRDPENIAARNLRAFVYLELGEKAAKEDNHNRAKECNELSSKDFNYSYALDNTQIDIVIMQINPKEFKNEQYHLLSLATEKNIRRSSCWDNYTHHIVLFRIGELYLARVSTFSNSDDDQDLIQAFIHQMHGITYIRAACNQLSIEPRYMNQYIHYYFKLVSALLTFANVSFKAEERNLCKEYLSEKITTNDSNSAKLQRSENTYENIFVLAARYFNQLYDFLENQLDKGSLLQQIVAHKAKFALKQDTINTVMINGENKISLPDFS